MTLPSQIKPISYLKAHAADIVRHLREPLVITQNGEAKVVIQDVKSYEDIQQTLALLKILVLGEQQIEREEFENAGTVVARMLKERAQK